MASASLPSYLQNKLPTIHCSVMFSSHWLLTFLATATVFVGLECSEEEKVSLYRSQLEKLPPVNYVTVRRLMGHLYHISLQCERNLMPVENLAAIWGPTLMHVEVPQHHVGSFFTFVSLVAPARLWWLDGKVDLVEPLNMDRTRLFIPRFKLWPVLLYN